MLRVAWKLRNKPKIFAPWRIAARHKPLFITRQIFDTGVVLSHSVDLRLKELASLRAASLIGCTW